MFQSRDLWPILALFLLISGCQQFNEKPRADFSYNPEIGNNLAVYHFDGSLSTDREDSTAYLKYRWDWEGDQTWDTEFSSIPTTSHRFAKGGLHSVCLEVKDSKNNMSHVIKEIKVINIESGTFTDPRDQQNYQWVKMENVDQIWMAENLRWKPEQGSWRTRSWRQNYGRLYNWNTAMKACPPGWHLPADYEWSNLQFRYGMSDNSASGFNEDGEIGLKFKSRTGWRAQCNGTNQYEFTIVPAGYRNYNGKNARVGMMSYFWTSTSTDSTHAYNRGFHYASKGISRDPEDRRVGFSVRCVKDQSATSSVSTVSLITINP